MEYVLLLARELFEGAHADLTWLFTELSVFRVKLVFVSLLFEKALLLLEEA